MSALLNTRHERFAQALAAGSTPASAYVSAGYKKTGAAQNAARLLRDEQVQARVTELQTAIASNVVALEISNRNARLQAQQQRWDGLREVMRQRAIQMADVPGGATGLLCRDYTGVLSARLRIAGLFLREIGDAPKTVHRREPDLETVALRNPVMPVTDGFSG